MQPLIEDDHGIVRFKANAIVRTLLDEASKRGYSLNDLAALDFSQADWEQFNQLIGYSLCGYHELSCVSDLSAFEASAVARDQFGAEVGGCRDHGCEIHSGIETEAP